MFFAKCQEVIVDYAVDTLGLEMTFQKNGGDVSVIKKTLLSGGHLSCKATP